MVGGQPQAIGSIQASLLMALELVPAILTHY